MITPKQFTFWFFINLIAALVGCDLEPETQIAIAPFIPALGLTLLTTGYQIFEAEQQKKLARELMDQPRPEFEVPKEAYNALTGLKHNAALRGLPGQDIMEMNLDQATAEGYERIKQLSTTPEDAQGAAERMAGKKSESLRQLAVEGARFQADADNKVAAQEMNIAGMKANAQYQYELQPYLQTQNAAHNLLGSAQQTYMNAFNNISNFGMGMLYYGGDDLFGGGKSKPATPADPLSSTGEKNFMNDYWGNGGGSGMYSVFNPNQSPNFMP